MRPTSYLLALVIVCTSGCGDATSPTPDGGTPPTPDGGTPDGGGGMAARTLDNCAASVASNVPEFFRTFFQCSDIRMDGSDVLLSTVNLPPYQTYYYGRGSPNFAEFDSSRGSQYRPNPAFLRAQQVTIRVPMDPTARGLTITPALVDGVGGGASDYALGPVGLALNSVVLFNPLARSADSGW